MLEETLIPFDFDEVYGPSRDEIKAAETTPKILKPKFLVWAMSVALATACPPVLICQSRHGRVTVRGVNV